jgi:membrane protein DedA with SNARE-associated domain
MEGWFDGIFGRFHYLAPFVVLFLCGVGLPLPEEVTLLGSGLLLHQGKVEFVPIVLVCSAAILLGDSIPYILGRRYGMNALRVRWVRRIIHPERFARLEQRFQRHGNWAVFACRFFAGVRIPGYFLAGTLRMGYGRFLLLDCLGVMLTVPISIWLGRIFADQIDRLNQSYRQLHLVLAFAVVALILVLSVRARSRRSSQRAAEGLDDRPTGGDTPS